MKETLKIKEAAELLHMNEQMLRLSIRYRHVQFGEAEFDRSRNRWKYHISIDEFETVTGIITKCNKDPS